MNNAETTTYTSEAIKTKKEWLKIEQLQKNPNNPRLESNGSHLIESIRSEGLTTNLMARKEGEFYIVYQGNNRLSAALDIQATNETEYKRLFPKGIPVDVIIEASEAALMRKVMDHGSVRGLDSAFELYYSARQLMKTHNYSEGDLLAILGDSIDRIFSLENKPKAKLKLATARAIGIPEYIQARKEIRRGVTQTIMYISKGPDFLLSQYKDLAQGIAPVIKLTRPNIKKVYDAFLLDMAIKNEEGICDYSQSVDGPNTKDIIAGLKKALIEEGEAVKVEKVKPMNTKALEELATQCVSVGLKKILARVMGASSIDLSEIDSMLATFDD